MCTFLQQPLHFGLALDFTVCSLVLPHLDMSSSSVAVDPPGWKLIGMLADYLDMPSIIRFSWTHVRACAIIGLEYHGQIAVPVVTQPAYQGAGHSLTHWTETAPTSRADSVSFTGSSFRLDWPAPLTIWSSTCRCLENKVTCNSHSHSFQLIGMHLLNTCYHSNLHVICISFWTSLFSRSYIIEVGLQSPNMSFKHMHSSLQVLQSSVQES